MYRLKNGTEDPLLLIPNNCETPIEQNHTKTQQTLEIKPTQPKETFSNTPCFNLGLEVSNCILNITE